MCHKYILCSCHDLLSLSPEFCIDSYFMCVPLKCCPTQAAWGLPSQWPRIIAGILKHVLILYPQLRSVCEQVGPSCYG